MPGEEDKTVVAAGDSAAPAAKAGSKSKLLLFAGIGVGAIVIGVVLALFVLKPMLAPSGDAPENAAAQGHESEKKTEEKKANEKKYEEKSSHGEKGSEAGESLLYSIEDIVINPAGTGGSRFLSVSFGFELDSPQMMIDFRSREAMIRDALITILSSKTVAQLTDVRQKEIIRYQIKKRVSELMKTDAIAGVYYTDFVLQ